MITAALATAGLGALMGGIGGASPTKTTTSPWKPQQKYLKDVFGEGQSIYDNRQGPYGGSLYAGMGDQTRQGLSDIGQFNPYGQAVSQGAMDAGAGLYGAGQAGAGAASTLFGMGTQDPTQANIAAASQYANSPYMQGAINAANRDTARALSEGALPANNRNASIGGNTDSSRTGMRDAMAERAADDRMADVSASMRGDAFQRGLAQAEGQRVANMGAVGAAGSQFQGLFGSGLYATDMGQRNMYNNFDANIAGGQVDQADRQGYVDEAFNQWGMRDNYDAQKLAQYKAAVSGNYGGTQTSGGGLNGAMQGMAGGATTGLGLYNTYKYPREGREG